MYTNSLELKENTNLIDTNFQFNIFNNVPEHNNILHLHWHDNFEIIYIVRGEAVFYVGSESVTAQPGDIVFVNSSQLHSGYSINNTYVEFYAIVYNKSIFNSSLSDPFYARYISPFMEGKLLFPSKISNKCDNYPVFDGIIKSIVNECGSKTPGYELIIKSYLSIVIASVYRHYTSSTSRLNSETSFEFNKDRFQKLIDYVEKNYSEKITIEKAAKIVNLSCYHFCKMFKKATGRTFIEFLNLYRVNVSEELLRKTTLPITHIAEKVGFCNINYFDKIFKQYKNYSPSQCRK